MSKEKPDYQDATLTLELYDLRREAVMRQSRDAINGKFWPKSYEDLKAIAQMDHPHNAAFRQVVSYWEMVYGMAKHGITNPDYLVENNGEGLFLYAKVLPYLEQYRKEFSPRAFQNAEWISQNCKTGRERLEITQGYLKQGYLKKI